jgi:hypothetical protein
VPRKCYEIMGVQEFPSNNKWVSRIIPSRNSPQDFVQDYPTIMKQWVSRIILFRIEAYLLYGSGGPGSNVLIRKRLYGMW